MRLKKLIIIAVVTASILSSCHTYKNIPYFQDLPDSARLNLMKPTYSDLVIAPDDILSINIQTLDPNANQMFNQALPSAFSSSNAFASSSASSSSGISQMGSIGTAASGILVDKNGDISLPLLGVFHLQGLTTLQAQDSVLTRASIYYNKPTVYVRFANFKIIVLGEVQRPGTYIMPNEKVTIFDALGLAGDLTIFAKRENVLLLRDSANQNKLIRLNLNSKDIVNSDYFYLKKNDVIYVEPTKAKLANVDANQNRNYTIAAAILSVLVIAATRLK